MNIGTAVPEPDELNQAPHHFIQNISIHEPYTAGDFEKQAMATLKRLFEKQEVVVMVGGSALYEKAVTEGLDHFPEVPSTVLDTLNQELEDHGIAHLVQRLHRVDPHYAEMADLDNPRRVIRALAVYAASGNKYSDYLNQEKESRPFHTIKVGLEAPRDILYTRINNRVDRMIERGLVNEAKALHDYKDLLPLKTVGYQELFPYFESEYDLQEAIRLIKRNSRRFAKRQMTWYRKDDQVKWYSYDTSHTKIVRQVAGLFMEP